MQLYIKYNPYTVTTDCELDGVPVASESPMSIKNGVRLQEWIDTLPERIEKIADVNDLTIVFTERQLILRMLKKRLLKLICLANWNMKSQKSRTLIVVR